MSKSTHSILQDMAIAKGETIKSQNPSTRDVVDALVAGDIDLSDTMSTHGLLAFFAGQSPAGGDLK